MKIEVTVSADDIAKGWVDLIAPSGTTLGAISVSHGLQAGDKVEWEYNGVEQTSGWQNPNTDICKAVAKTAAKYKEMFKQVPDIDVTLPQCNCGACPDSPGFGISGSDTMEILKAAIPGFERMYATDPVTGHSRDLPSIIQKLNDGDGWSREEIADWLDALNLDLSINLNK